MFKYQEDINQIFASAMQLKKKEIGRGFQAGLSRKTGISIPHINDIVWGRKGCIEEKKRAIATALGYSYEDFLNLGRGKESKKTKTEGTDIAENIIRKKDGFADPLEGGKMRIKRLIQDAETLLQSNSVYGKVLAMNIDAFMLCYNDMKRKKGQKRSRPQMIGQGAYS